MKQTKQVKLDIKTLRKAVERFTWFAGWFKIGPTLSQEDRDLAEAAGKALDRLAELAEHSIPMQQERLL